MKYNGDFDRQIRIQQHLGGYIVFNDELGGMKTRVFSSFEDAVDYVAEGFGLTFVGERVVISSTREPKEENGPSKPLGDE